MSPFVIQSPPGPERPSDRRHCALDLLLMMSHRLKSTTHPNTHWEDFPDDDDQQVNSDFLF